MYLIQNFQAWAYVGAMRALFSVPGHFFFAVVMGYYVSKAFFDDPSQRPRNIFLALALPILLHSAFDALLMVSTVSAAATGLIALFAGLWIFMAKTAKKLFNKHLTTDEAIQKEAEFNRWKNLFN
jgi:RsiW-degrading membrane proteinase PrsW (M82 family)